MLTCRVRPSANSRALPRPGSGQVAQILSTAAGTSCSSSLPRSRWPHSLHAQMKLANPTPAASFAAMRSRHLQGSKRQHGSALHMTCTHKACTWAVRSQSQNNKGSVCSPLSGAADQGTVGTVSQARQVVAEVDYIQCWQLDPAAVCPLSRSRKKAGNSAGSLMAS